LFLPLGLASIPAAFIGGTLSIPSHFYKPVMGEVLLLAAWHVFSHGKRLDNEKLSKVSSLILLSVGAGLGFLSGLTGIGGGVKKVISGVAAAFILVNSISGLIGVLLKALSCLVFCDTGYLLWCWGA
jgi:uncharacterized membrane protein YfcA